MQHAFVSVSVSPPSFDEMGEQIQAFVRRWGGLDLETCAAVLSTAEGMDRVVAAFAVGYIRSDWAQERLRPFLQHEEAGVRWASAFSLGAMKDAQALPALIQMLQEYVPPPFDPLPNPSPELGPYWFWGNHATVARLLGNMGDVQAIPALRNALASQWDAEQKAPPRTDLDWWWDYQDTLVYALGQLGVLDAFVQFDIPEARRRLWMVTCALGTVQGQAYYREQMHDEQGYLGIVVEAIGHTLKKEGPLQAIYRSLLQQLRDHYHISLQEAELLVGRYWQDYDDRARNI